MVGDHTRQKVLKTLSQRTIPALWHTSIIPATGEVEVEEDEGQRLAPGKSKTLSEK
jgi:hypothetical protein